MILAPRHLARVAAQVDPADAVVLAQFGAAQAGEKAFRLIGACFIRAVGQRVVDDLDRELGAKLVPTDTLVGMDGAALLDAGLDEVHRGGFRLEHGGQGSSVALADGDHDLTFAGLVLGKATVLAVFRADVAADVAAINFDHSPGTADSGALHLRRHRLAELVAQDECRLVGHVEIAAELQGVDALHRVHEDHDGRHVVPDMELVVGEQRAAGRAEVASASLAAIARGGATGHVVGDRAFAVRAER